MSTGSEVGPVSRARAYRWLAAARRVTVSRPASSTHASARHDGAPAMLRALAAAMRPDEPGVRGHAERVGILSGSLARAIGLSPAEAEVVALAGALHDIGALGVLPTTADAGNGAQRGHPLIGAQLVAPFDVLGLEIGR